MSSPDLCASFTKCLAFSFIPLGTASSSDMTAPRRCSYIFVDLNEHRVSGLLTRRAGAAYLLFASFRDVDRVRVLVVGGFYQTRSSSAGFHVAIPSLIVPPPPRVRTLADTAPNSSGSRWLIPTLCGLRPVRLAQCFLSHRSRAALSACNPKRALLPFAQVATRNGQIIQFSISIAGEVPRSFLGDSKALQLIPISRILPHSPSTPLGRFRQNRRRMVVECRDP